MLGMDEATALSLLEAMDWNLEVSLLSFDEPQLVNRIAWLTLPSSQAAVAMQLDDGASYSTS